jgi:eukaryotic-like serine/threonine-protein kinase
MTLLAPGTAIRDTYEVERFLGEGAFAEVYRVKHRFLGRQALKMFKRVGMNVADIQEMLGEAILLSRIGHPNIVRVFDANIFETERGSCGYFTMEYVAGGTLQKFWQSFGANLVPVPAAIDLIKQVCRGLALAHGEKPPIIHRDIKPQNILVGYEADGLRARVSDFGLAKSVNPLTLLATTAGTAAFKAPEAFADKKGDSCASDVWAIAATLYMLLTDKLPFESPIKSGEIRPIAGDARLIPPSRINPNVSAAIDEVLARALQFDARSRYQNAQELLVALDTAETMKSKPMDAKSANFGPSKAALGAHSGGNDEDCRRLVGRALECGRTGRLAEAADVMEEAFNKSPSLRAKYSEAVKLWRRGISM